MRNTFSISFFLKKNYKDSSKSSVITRITVNKQATHITTGLKCLPNNWDVKNQRIARASKEAKEANQILDNIRSTIHRIYYEQFTFGSIPSAQKIKEILMGQFQKKYLLMELFESHNENFKKQIGICKEQSTYQKYKETKNHLAAFLKKEKQLEDICLNQVNYQFICDFYTYLRKDTKCGHNTACKNLQLFKRIIMMAVNNNLINSNPFASFQIKFENIDRTFLTEQELTTIIHKDFSDNKKLDFSRDLFIFSCFTGLSYIDVQNLQKKHFFTLSDDNVWIKIQRTKTKETSLVKIFSLSQAIIEKYTGTNSPYIFPTISNQKLNAYLKEIAQLCKIDKKLTYHVGRHTFATTLVLSNGIALESLSKMLGHSDIKTTRIYAQITEKKLNEDATALGKILDKYSLP